MAKTGFFIFLLALFCVLGSHAQTKIDGSQVNVAGPRPYIDVTARPYNAKGDGTADDTAAIQAAINAACAISLDAGRPGVFLPPMGKYRAVQPQSPSTSPVFNTCSYLYIYSNGSQEAPSGLGQFSTPPQGAAIVVDPGSSPNDMPVFLFSQGNGTNVTLENLQIYGYNQAVWYQSTNIEHLTNVYLYAQNTGHTDNTPLRISNSFWITMLRGAVVGSGTEPCGVWTVEAPLGFEQPDLGLFSFKDMIWSCNGINAINRYTGTNVIGTIHFQDVVMENVTNNGFFNVSTTSGNVSLTGFTIENSSLSDPVAPEPLLQLSAGSGGKYAGISISNSSTASSAPTILVNSGTVQSYELINSGVAQDSNGFPVGNGFAITGQQDAVSTTTFPNTCAYFCAGGTAQAPANFWQPESSGYGTLGADATQGFMFGDGTTNAFSASLKENAVGTMDVQFAKLLPPTGAVGIGTTGGSLANGAYTADVWSTTQASSSNCWVSPYSTFAQASATLTGGNNAITWSWTLPQTTINSPTGYCISISAAGGAPNTGQAIFVSGGSTTSFLYTGQTQTAYGVFTPTTLFGATHRLTYNSLGIGTTSPRAAGIDTAGILGTTATTFSGLPTCNSTNEGLMRAITDSTTATWGATIAGSSTNHVLAYCDATNWTVAAK